MRPPSWLSRRGGERGIYTTPGDAPPKVSREAVLGDRSYDIAQSLLEYINKA